MEWTLHSPLPLCWIFRVVKQYNLLCVANASLEGFLIVETTIGKTKATPLSPCLAQWARYLLNQFQLSGEMYSFIVVHSDEEFSKMGIQFSSFLGKDAWMTSQLKVAFIRKLHGSSMCLAHFLDLLSIGCTTRHFQTSGRLGQELNVSTVGHFWKMNIDLCLTKRIVRNIPNLFNLFLSVFHKV